MEHNFFRILIDSNIVGLGYISRFVFILKVFVILITHSSRDGADYLLLYTLYGSGNHPRTVEAADTDSATAIIFKYGSFLVDTSSMLKVFPKYLCAKGIKRSDEMKGIDG